MSYIDSPFSNFMRNYDDDFDDRYDDEDEHENDDPQDESDEGTVPFVIVDQSDSCIFFAYSKILLYHCDLLHLLSLTRLYISHVPC